MLGVLFRVFSDTRDDLGFSTGNTSAARVFSETIGARLFDSNCGSNFGLGLPGLLISGDSGADDAAPEDPDGCSDRACGIAGF
jgi:hypothetical protein